MPRGNGGEVHCAPTALVALRSDSTVKYGVLACGRAPRPVGAPRREGIYFLCDCGLNGNGTDPHRTFSSTNFAGLQLCNSGPPAAPSFDSQIDTLVGYNALYTTLDSHATRLNGSAIDAPPVSCSPNSLSIYLLASSTGVLFRTTGPRCALYFSPSCSPDPHCSRP